MNKNIRIKGRFTSNELQRAVLELSRSAGMSVTQFARENSELLDKINRGGGNIAARAQLENIEYLFRTYHKKDYSFIDADSGEKLTYEEAINIAIDWAYLQSIDEVKYAQLEYKINLGNKKVLLPLAEIQNFFNIANMVENRQISIKEASRVLEEFYNIKAAFYEKK